jgi:hypothetical protein
MEFDTKEDDSMNTRLALCRFELGQVVATTRADETLDHQDIQTALQRHYNRDWGDVCSEDWVSNNQAVKQGFRILSAYKDRNDTKFWIITEADRSVTTVLLPEDY